MKQLIYLVVLLLFMSTFTNQVFAQSNWKVMPDANKIENPIKDDVKAAVNGKKIYKQMCSICHGNKGKGDGMAGMALNPKPADFTSNDVQNQSDGAIYWKLTEGKTPMAGYKDILTETQRWELVNYIRTLKK